MFNISISKIFLALLIGLVVLGPKKFLSAFKCIIFFFKKIRLLLINTRNEFEKYSTMQELQNNINQISNIKNNNMIFNELINCVNDLKKEIHYFHLKNKSYFSNNTYKDEHNVQI
ncbi:Sec-independent protein translocase subunit TatA/TatB [Candidatus Tachikawaea gelatinosa]|uniref:Sec-independent protein translocase subunit TatA/TatB n=1 Tax=Candidatus Tachikawaea gelatinosa TaxID=1410383 RepID=UPI000597421E|nr:hypothetical protein [Candidatus Tachikawaea gelatinosa]